MGTLNLSRRERQTLIAYLSEAFKLRGVPAEFYQVDTAAYDLNKDIQVNYLPPVPIFMLFDENPKATLKKLHWFVEQEEVAAIGHFITLDRLGNPIKVIRKSRVDVVYEALTGDTKQSFLLDDLRANDIYQFSYVAKLTPYRERLTPGIVSIGTEQRTPYLNRYLNDTHSSN